MNWATNLMREQQSPCPDFHAIRADLAARGFRVGLSGVKRLHQMFLARPHPDAADFRVWVITYADPTGETATTNVLRTQAKEMTP